MFLQGAHSGIVLAGAANRVSMQDVLTLDGATVSGAPSPPDTTSVRLAADGPSLQNPSPAQMQMRTQLSLLMVALVGACGTSSSRLPTSA